MTMQRSDDWYQARLGRATASRFYDIVKGDRYAGWKNYKADLVIERLTGKPIESFTSGPMQWGIDGEPLARLMYFLKTKNEVEECGFFAHEELAAGASPDGLIGTDGGLEIKMPNTSTHLTTLHTGKVPDVYMAQMQGGMWITGRKWWDYVSYDPRLPENAALFILRVERDEEYIQKLEAQVRKFLAEVDEEVMFVQNYGKEAKDGGSKKPSGVPKTQKSSCARSATNQCGGAVGHERD